MNYKKMSLDQLLNLINTTTDTTILADAENEFAVRFTPEENRWVINESDIDEDIMAEINKTWRAN